MLYTINAYIKGLIYSDNNIWNDDDISVPKYLYDIKYEEPQTCSIGNGYVYNVSAYTKLSVDAESKDEAYEKADDQLYEKDFGLLKSCQCFVIRDNTEMTRRQVNEECLKVCHKNQDLQIVIPNKGIILYMQFGMDQLLHEDLEAGYVGYIDYSTYDVSERLNNNELEDILNEENEEPWDTYRESKYSGLLLLKEKDIDAAGDNIGNLVDRVLDEAELVSEGGIYPRIYPVGLLN